MSICVDVNISVCLSINVTWSINVGYMLRVLPSDLLLDPARQLCTFEESRQVMRRGGERREDNR